MDVYTRKREKITVAEDPFSSGGEGEVRMIVSAPSAYVGRCVKLYYQTKRSKQQEAKIVFMSDNPPASIAGNGFMIGWPQEPLYDASRKFLGFVMPVAPADSVQLVNLTTPKVNSKLRQEWHQKYSLTNGKYALLSRLKLLHNIAVPMYLLHSTGKYVLKDFKPQNVLITHEGHVAIVDMDSIQICDKGKVLFHGRVATPGYIPTEFYTEGVGKNEDIPLDKSWDNFALGVVFYQILFGLHPYVVTPKSIGENETNDISQNISKDLFPFGANNQEISSYPLLHDKFKVLPPTIQQLFLRCFAADYNGRPSPEEWGKEIHKLIIAAGDVPKPAPKPVPPCSQREPSGNPKQSPADFSSSRGGCLLALILFFMAVCGGMMLLRYIL